MSDHLEYRAVVAGGTAKRWSANFQQWRRNLVSFLAGGSSVVANTSNDKRGGVPRHGLYRILICRPNHRLGNLLLLTPLLCELARNYPGSQVDLVVGGEQAKPVFGGFPNVGTIYALPRHALRKPWEFIRVLYRLRQQHYDLAIDPDVGSQSSRMLANLSRATYRIGLAGRKSVGKLTCAMPVPATTRHMAQLPVALLRWAIASNQVPEDDTTIPPLDLQLSPAERAWGRSKLGALLDASDDAADLPTIALYTHATGAKRHEREWWLQMLDALRSNFPRARFIEILPAHGQSDFAGAVAGYYSSKPRRVAAVIAATQMIVVADSGIMHLACASRGPAVVGLFRCTDPEVYGPYGAGNRAVWTNGQHPIDICNQVGGHNVNTLS